MTRCPKFGQVLSVDSANVKDAGVLGSDIQVQNVRVMVCGL